MSVTEKKVQIHRQTLVCSDDVEHILYDHETSYPNQKMSNTCYKIKVQYIHIDIHESTHTLAEHNLNAHPRH